MSTRNSLLFIASLIINNEGFQKKVAFSPTTQIEVEGVCVSTTSEAFCGDTD